MGLTKFSGHYANYPIGGFYKRHLDCFQNNNSRLLSVILYLNPNWTTADGGKLRIYNQVSHVDISPIAGTLVCFLSRESEHEVLLNNAIRQSFTGWFTNEALL
jgi:SM-20-related protein